MSLWDDALDVATSVVDRVSDAGKALGVSTVTDPFKEAVTEDGPLRDFARTGFGTVLLRAASLSAEAGAATFLGPIGVGIIMAAPGMIRGDDFGKAFADELVWRVNFIAKVFGQTLVDEATKTELAASTQAAIAPAIEQLRKLPLKHLVGLAGTELRKAADTARDDIALAAKAALTRNPDDLAELQRVTHDPDWNPVTGVNTRERAEEKRAARNALVSRGQRIVQRADDIAAGQALIDAADRAAADRASYYGLDAAEAPRNRARENIMLGAVVLAAGGALWWWWKVERNRA